MLAFICGLSCVLVFVETCVRSPPGGGLAQSVYSCTPPVRRGRRAGSFSYSFTQLDCDYSLLNDVAFCAYPLHFHFHLDYEGPQKYCQAEFLETGGRSNRSIIIQSILARILTRPLSKALNVQNKTMLKCIST